MDQKTGRFVVNQRDCTSAQIQKYQKRISVPLLARIDNQIEAASLLVR